MPCISTLKVIKVTGPSLVKSTTFNVAQTKGSLSIRYDIRVAPLPRSSTSFGLYSQQFANRLIFKKDFCTTNNNVQSMQVNNESVNDTNVDGDLPKLRILLQKERYGSIAGAMFHLKTQNKILTQEHYKIAIESYCHLRRSKEILNLLQEMAENNIPISITEYNYLLKSVALELKNHTETLNIKKMIEDAGYQLDAFSYGILLHSSMIGLERVKHIMESRILLQEMRERKIRPNLQFFEEVIRSYHHRDSKSIIYWYNRMTKNGLKPPKNLLPIIKNAFIRCGMRTELEEFMTNVWNTTEWFSEGNHANALDLASKLDIEFITPEKIDKIGDDVGKQELEKDKESIHPPNSTKS